jgi:deoxyribose-phosphate aldolase
MSWMKGIKALNNYIDHTNLKPTALPLDIVTLCEEAKAYQFKSVCIQPEYVTLAKKEVQNSNVLVCTVIGFPLGANTIDVKAWETKQAVADGADEIDMVLSISHALQQDKAYLTSEINAVVKAASGRTVKVILETCYLTDEQIITACEAAASAGAHFVKTSTGFGTGGATVEHVRLMRQHVPSSMEVKASGGVRSLADATAMIEAGATRLGTSSGVSIMQGQTSSASY